MLAVNQLVGVCRPAERNSHVAAFHPVPEEKPSIAGLERMVVRSKPYFEFSAAVAEGHLFDTEETQDGIVSGHQEVQAAPGDRGIVVIHEIAVAKIPARSPQCGSMQEIERLRGVFDDSHFIS